MVINLTNNSLKVSNSKFKLNNISKIYIKLDIVK